MTVAILGGHKNFSSHGSFKLDRVDKFSLGKLDHLCQLKRNLGDLSGRKRTFSKSSQKYGLCLLSKPYVLPFPEIMSVFFIKSSENEIKEIMSKAKQYLEMVRFLCFQKSFVLLVEL